MASKIDFFSPEQCSFIPLIGKKPIEQNWQQWSYKIRPYNPAEFQGRNTGMACGPASNRLVLDVDDLARFKSTCRANNWTLPETLTVETGRGLPHYHFTYPDDGKHYGNKSFGPKSKRNYGFDLRGAGGQVVAPGSIHQDTGKPYRIVKNVPPAAPPQWLLDLYDEPKPEPRSSTCVGWTGDIGRLPIKHETKSLILYSTPVGGRSEAIMRVLNALVWSRLHDSEIIGIFEQYPIGEKYREKGNGRERWLAPQIAKARDQVRDFAEDRAEREAIMSECAEPYRPETSSSNDDDAECFLEALTETDEDSSDEYEWHIQMLVPKAEPMIIGGKGGSGKTTLALDFTVQMLETDPDAAVVYICAEGTYRDTKIRARQMGLTYYQRFFFLKRKGGATSFKLSEKSDLELVKSALESAKAKGLKIAMVVIDSIRGMQKGSLSDDAVGEVMQNVNGAICQELGATACYIHHSKKNIQDITAMDALLGSVTIVNSVRHALFIRKLSNKVREVEVCKSNLGYEDHFFRAEMSPDNRIILAHEGLRGDGDDTADQGQLDKAEELVLSMLSPGEWVPAYQIFNAAEGKEISVESVRRAKKLHNIDVKRHGKTWKWRLESVDP